MNLRVFIVDDEAPARARLKTLLSDIMQQCPHELVGEADNGPAALDGIADSHPDIVFLDVQMPGMTGIELASHLSKQCGDAAADALGSAPGSALGSAPGSALGSALAPTIAPTIAPAIIFVTAYDEYAVKAFDVHALDYLLKPVRASRLAQAITRVSALRAAHVQQTAAAAATAIAATVTTLHAKRQHFSVQERGRMLLVPVAEVLYLRAESKYVTVGTKARDYLIEDSLVSIEEEMTHIFVRAHRNALVARAAIIGVERGVAGPESCDEHGKGNEKTQEVWQVILRGSDERLPISRRQWPVIKALVR
jgi:two-component system response regulator AlgR